MSVLQRPRPGAWTPAAVIGLAALLLAGVVGEGGSAAAHWLWALLALAAGVRIAVRARGEHRLPWALLAAGAITWSLGAVWYAAAFSMSGGDYGSPADALWLSAYVPLAGAGLVLAHRSRAGHDADVALDGLVAALGAAAIGAAVILPIVDTSGASALTALMTLAYPVADMMLLGIAAGGFVLGGGNLGATWRWFGGGLVVLAVADIGFAVEVARTGGGWTLGSVTDVCYPLAFWLMAGGAPPREHAEPVRAKLHGVPVIPLLGAALSIGVLLADHVAAVPAAARLLATAAVVVAVVRTALALRANVRLQDSAAQALRDELTGLANRRCLLRDLDLVIASAPGPATLALFDLDGFKAYNDAYGHPAGDALLASLGRRLQRAVAGHGEAYRLGGDEFCVVIGAQGVDHRLVLDRAIDALRQEGDGFSIGASYGDVVVPQDAPTSAAALQLADTRMYARKDAGRASTRRQSRDLLLQLLHEQQPDLEEHSGDVGELVVAVGRRLGLDADGLDHARHAAELHDVGKVAIPAAILHKPGPLDEDEWTLMRRHTIIGERILSAVPALVPVGRIVRSTHERWDGAGYPDGLRGDEIPLAARIIAVCDTYHAITTDRPYRAGRGDADALAELRRCAGTQFDPAVVAAFAATLDAGFAVGDHAAGAAPAATGAVARRVLPAGAIAQNAAGELAELAKLRGLLRATQLAGGGAGVADVLEAIAQTIASSLGFRVVSVNLFRPEWDDFVCTAVNGAEAVRERLLGKTEPAESWRPLFDERFARSGAYFVPAGAIDYDDDGVTWHVPDIEPSDDPGAWHPDDVLVVPLSSGQEMLGVVSVDEPVWGRRPSDGEIEVLVAVAEHAALAVKSARSRSIARNARQAGDRSSQLGRELAAARTPADVAAAVVTCVREALRFGHVDVELAADPDALEALLDGGAEEHGCVVLAGGAAANARTWCGRSGSTRNGRGRRAWADHLIAAPVRDADGALLAVIWADDPADRLLPHASTLRVLRAIAAQAVVPLAWGRQRPAPARGLGEVA